MAAEKRDVIEHIGDLLSCGDTRSVKTVMSGDNFERVLQERANDLIPIVSIHLNKQIMQISPAVLRYSEKLIVKCAEIGNPKECFLEFLVQIETLDEVKFEILLKPIQTTLLRIPERKGPLMQCVFKIIYTFINTLPLPQYQPLNKDSELLLDCDENVQRVTKFYHLIVSFYEPFVFEVSVKHTKENRINNIKLVLLQSLFHLLGNPVVALDLEYNERGSSSLRVLASRIVTFILKLQTDPLQFLTLVEDKEFISVNEEKTFYLSSNEIKFCDLSLSVFFYLIFSANKCTISIPYVYDKLFVSQNILTLALVLLRDNNLMVLRKGLLLCKVIIGKIEAGSVHFYNLQYNVHKEVIELLSRIAVYHEVEEDRKLAAILIKQHLFIFEPKAQFYILLNSVKMAPHPTVAGFLTTMLTSRLRETFINEGFKEYFTGKLLFDLLNVFCTLEKGVETDLILNKDHILSALNLIIFLTRRDRENFTGVWYYTCSLSQNFLNPLRQGICLSRAHFKRELETLSDPQETESGSKLAVTVVTEELARTSTEEKKVVINSGFTVFDLIEHILIRANECIEDYI